MQRKKLSDRLSINRVVTGLWQIADMEREGTALPPDRTADYLQGYVESGFDTFDMADHYGSAEIITGQLLARYPKEGFRPLALTKWCPTPGPMTADIVRRGIQQSLDRLEVDKIDLLQFHWWRFDHPSWLDALHELSRLREEGLISEIGVTNFDAMHLHVALADGIPIVTNQVVCSLIDRRATGLLAEVCARHNVSLLAYGTLCGGFLSDSWLNVPEPTDIKDWSKMKYKRFIDAIGGWDIYQKILKVVAKIAKKHHVSIANVASRWVLENKHIAAIIIGIRPGQNEHCVSNSQLFDFELDQEDQVDLETIFSKTYNISGDCGDEYRKPPFLTASGDLSHHLTAFPSAFKTDNLFTRPKVKRAYSGSAWEDIAGYCRARRIGNRILVSGTTATAGTERVVAAGDAAAQTTFILDKIIGAVIALGGAIEDITMTRIYLVNIADTEAVSLVHGRVFGSLKPTNTLIAVAALAGDYIVEIEAEAIITTQTIDGT